MQMSRNPKVWRIRVREILSGSGLATVAWSVTVVLFLSETNMKNIVPPSPIRTLSIFPTDICFWEALHKTDLFIIGWHELTTQGQGLGVPNPESCWSWWMTDLEDELREEKSTRANGMFQILRCGSRIQDTSQQWTSIYSLRSSWDWRLHIPAIYQLSFKHNKTL